MLKQLRKDIADALKGTTQDYTSIPIGKAIFLLAIPMILEMFMESIFAVADIWFVSRLGDESAIATIGNTEAMMTIIYAIAVGLTNGTVGIVSRRVGEKKLSEASKTAGQALIIVFGVSMLLMIPGIFFSKNLLSMIGSSNTVIENGYMYPTIMLGSNIIVLLLFIINGIFRSSGDAARSMRVLWFANIINIILDPILIFGLGPIPSMGIKGAAIATVIGRGLAVIYQFYLLFNDRGKIKITLSCLLPDFKIIKNILKLSAGGVSQSVIATSSWLGLVIILNQFGDAVMAGYTIAIRIILFSLLPAWGLSNAASTLVGQNLGAGFPDRSEKSALRTGLVNIVLMAVVAVIQIFLAGFLTSFFTQDPIVAEESRMALTIISFGYLAYAFGMVMSQSFNGAGDTITPTILNFICFWILEIPLAWLFAIHWEIGQNGVYYAIVVAESILALLGYWAFSMGRWKRKIV